MVRDAQAFYRPLLCYFPHVFQRSVENSGREGTTNSGEVLQKVREKPINSLSLRSKGRFQHAIVRQHSRVKLGGDPFLRGHVLLGRSFQKKTLRSQLGLAGETKIKSILGIQWVSRELSVRAPGRRL